MVQISSFLLNTTPVLRGRIDSQATTEASDVAAGSTVEPWIGLIVLGALLVTGAIAIIREVRIEERESRESPPHTPAE